MLHVEGRPPSRRAPHGLFATLTFGSKALQPSGQAVRHDAPAGFAEIWACCAAANRTRSILGMDASDLRNGRVRSWSRRSGWRSDAAGIASWSAGIASLDFEIPSATHFFCLITKTALALWASRGGSWWEENRDFSQKTHSGPFLLHLYLHAPTLEPVCDKPDAAKRGQRALSSSIKERECRSVPEGGRPWRGRQLGSGHER